MSYKLEDICDYVKEKIGKDSEGNVIGEVKEEIQEINPKNLNGL